MTRPGRSPRAVAGRLLVVLAAVLAAVLGAPGPGAAHPTLLFTTPAADTAEPMSPPSLVLVFNEPVTIGSGGLVVLDPASRPVGVTQAVTAREGRAVTARLTQQLPAGVYTVRWRVTGADGDLVESTFRFAVGAAVTGQGASGSAGSAGTSWPSAGWRWLLFAGLALALGGACGVRLSDSARAVRPDLPPLRGLEPVGAVVGLVAALGLAVGLVVDAGPGVLTAAPPGRVVLVEVAAFAACLVLWAAGRRRWGWLPLLVVPVAEGVRAHAQVFAPGWGALLTGVHLAAAAVWVGALAHVVRAGVAWRSHRAAVWWVVTGYARWAAWLFAAVVATGTASALLLVPASALTTTGYGRLLLVKVALVCVAAAAALTARWSLRRGPDRLPRIARATGVEVGVLAAILAVTAALVSTPPARNAPQPFAPPPAGVVLPLGTLAGQVGVAVAASDGQLVVRLSTPRVGDYYAPATAPAVPAGRIPRVGRRRGTGRPGARLRRGLLRGPGRLALRGQRAHPARRRAGMARRDGQPGGALAGDACGRAVGRGGRGDDRRRADHGVRGGHQ